MDATYKELTASLIMRHDMMIEQLHQFCAINSGTEHLAGLKTMHQTLASAFKPIADTIETHVMPPITTFTMKGDTSTQICGDALFIRKRPELKRRLLLSGHMDTVYSANHAFQTLTQINDNQINGPGVADMKGGLIVMLHALEAFEQLPIANSLGWDVLINADEEIGSPASSLLIKDIASHYQAALVYEPAMTSDGTFARQRKGSAKLTLIATGKAAHAGRAFDEGRNAICYLAEVIMAINQLNGQREGVTINIGKIAGGDALNVVPDKAVIKMDVRIQDSRDESWLMNQLNALLHQLQRPDYSLSLHGHFGRPVKHLSPQTSALFHQIERVGQQLGLTPTWKDSGGCCDGNNLAHYGLAVIDTLGVRGGCIHSEDEFILLDSLVERATLSALLLTDLAEGSLETLSS